MRGCRFICGTVAICLPTILLAAECEFNLTREALQPLTNKDVRDALLCLKEAIDDTEKRIGGPSVVATYSGSKVVPRDVQTRFQFDQRQIDTDNRVVTGDGWNFNVPRRGIYAFSVNYLFNFSDRRNVNPYTTCAIQVLANAGVNVVTRMISHAFDLQCQVSGVIELNPNDKVFSVVTHSFSDQSQSEVRTITGTFNAYLVQRLD